MLRMIFDEMWRKKMDAMKASERITTTKGSLYVRERQHRDGTGSGQGEHRSGRGTMRARQRSSRSALSRGLRW